MKGKRNPVAQHMNEFNKPRTYRDRKKHPSKKDEQRDKPLHRPYYRDHRNWTKEAMDAEDIFRDEGPLLSEDY